MDRQTTFYGNTVLCVALRGVDLVSIAVVLPSSVAALTTVMPCYLASQIVNFSDCSLCRMLLRGLLLACGERSTSR